MNITQALAHKVASVRYEDLSEDVRYWAIVSIMDTFGVMLAGTGEPAVQILEKVAGGSKGQALVLSSGRRASPTEAALINGVAAHVLDYDASNATFSGHPAAHLLPALFSLCEVSGRSGADFVAAYVAGFETQSRIARGIATAHFERGWFSTSTQGVFGAAAGACNLLGLNEAQTAQALSLAAMLAGGSVAHAGTMTKPLGAGHAARNGVLAALLIQQGFTAALDGIGDRRGFLNLFVGSDRYDANAMLENWGEPYDILETATGLKRHPCCGQFHSALDALGELIRTENLSAEDVAALRMRVVTTRFAHTNRPDPTSGTDAKFSVQYCLARTLLHGQPRLTDFEGDAYRDADVRELMTRIQCEAEPQTPSDLPLREQGAVKIELETRDGHLFSAERKRPIGRIPGDPPSQQMIEAKFIDCLKHSRHAAKEKELVQTLRDFAALPRAANIAEILAA